ncbi:hypothetical protein P378_16205 [Desulforamulus profundi]|uniref:Uncharacterized protein n=1 Tax=Desulforamulus profundi TaxID=1383067 RepID=A0A2C6L1W7_9FIRM|nr:hypothetical protein [Desulforamulus profundi]MCL5779900.1 hypothetical protein [Bacillota bacterium]PHJ37491.1 hypothetical protein P378_16205 [Desulforamulus profundi]
MKIKAEKQRAFNTSTMTSGGNYDVEAAQELTVTGQTKAGKQKKTK